MAQDLQMPGRYSRSSGGSGRQGLRLHARLAQVLQQVIVAETEEAAHINHSEAVKLRDAEDEEDREIERLSGYGGPANP